MNYLQIARETLSVESQALAQLSQRLDDEFSQVVDLILACEGRLVIGGIGKSGLIGKKMVATFASTGTPSFFLHPTEAFHGDLGMLKPIDIVMLICAVLQTRKGYVDTNRIGQTERLPVGYFLLVCGISGVTSALVIAVMRCVAEAQIVPLESVFWVANLATGAYIGLVVAVVTFATLCAAYFSAKRRRAKIEEDLDSAGDI